MGKGNPLIWKKLYDSKEIWGNRAKNRPQLYKKKESSERTCNKEIKI